MCSCDLCSVGKKPQIKKKTKKKNMVSNKSIRHLNSSSFVDINQIHQQRRFQRYLRRKLINVYTRNQLTRMPSQASNNSRVNTFFNGTSFY
jgi:hypothetical protein